MSAVPPEPTDEQLLAAVARLWAAVDPPPADLASGVLARLAAEDLDVELLTLVETDALAGVRRGGDEPGEEGSWTLEYAGPDVRVYLRLVRIEDRTRLDGWLVPGAGADARLEVEGAESVALRADEHGRLELAAAPHGAARLVLLGEDGRTRATPTFWIP